MHSECIVEISKLAPNLIRKGYELWPCALVRYCLKKERNAVGIGHFSCSSSIKFFWGGVERGEGKEQIREIITLRDSSLTGICSFLGPKKREVFLPSLLMLSRLLITCGHINIWHVGTVRMAALFTNTILGFQRLLCNSWESAGFVCLWAEESNSLIHSQGALVWLWQGHEPKIKVSRSGSAQYALLLPKSQRQCFNTGLIFFSSFSKQNQLRQTFFVILGNMGRLYLGSGCNLQCHWDWSMLPAESHK